MGPEAAVGPRMIFAVVGREAIGDPDWTLPLDQLAPVYLPLEMEAARSEPCPSVHRRLPLDRDARQAKSRSRTLLSGLQPVRTAKNMSQFCIQSHIRGCFGPRAPCG